jgi:YegS/Rv2252/BmrU family lipid kinase
MPKHKTKLIINPNAGLGRGWRWGSDLRPLVDEFGGADWAGTVYPGHAIEIARQAAQEGYETIISIGGDGTTHEVINGLMQAPPDKRPKLGIVPVGTGNDFAHNVGMPSQPELAMRKIFEGSPHKIDLGILSDEHGRQEYWGNVVGVGFDATVTVRSRKISFLRGFLVYLVSVLQTIILDNEAPLLDIQADTTHWQENTMMMVLCNGSREGGGFFVAPQAVTDDGILDYVSICQVSRLMMLRLLPEVMRGTHGRFRQIRMGTCKELSLVSDRPLIIHVDGEIYAGFGTDIRQVTGKILPNALEILR